MNMEDIKYMREQFGVSQRTIADYLSISQATYNRYELGIIKVPEDIMVELEDVFRYIEDNGNKDVLETKDYDDYEYEDLQKHADIVMVNLYMLLHAYAYIRQLSQHSISIYTGMCKETIRTYMSWKKMRKLTRVPRKDKLESISKAMQIEFDTFVKLLINNGSIYKGIGKGIEVLKETYSVRKNYTY